MTKVEDSTGLTAMFDLEYFYEYVRYAKKKIFEKYYLAEKSKYEFLYELDDIDN